MKKGYKPEGHNSVSPYLVIDGAAATIDFVTTVLGAKELMVVPGPDGRIRHAELLIDDTVVMVADSLDGWPPTASHVHVYVEDVDDTYRRAIAAGATPVQEPVKKDDSDKRGGVRDAGGTTWWISTKVA